MHKPPERAGGATSVVKHQAIPKPGVESTVAVGPVPKAESAVVEQSKVRAEAMISADPPKVKAEATSQRPPPKAQTEAIVQQAVPIVKAEATVQQQPAKAEAKAVEKARPTKTRRPTTIVVVIGGNKRCVGLWSL